MNQNQITHFKHLLMEYHGHEEEIKRIQDEINELEYRKHPFRSSDIIKMPEDNNAAKPYPYDLIADLDRQIEEKEREIDIYTYLNQKCDRTLKMIKNERIKQALILLYRERQDSDRVVSQLGFSAKGNMHRSIKRYLEEV